MHVTMSFLPRRSSHPHPLPSGEYSLKADQYCAVTTDGKAPSKDHGMLLLPNVPLLIALDKPAPVRVKGVSQVGLLDIRKIG